MDIDHLNCGELFEQAARGEASREPSEASGDGDVEAISEERDEDMRFDPAFFLVVDRPDGVYSYNLWANL